MKRDDTLRRVRESGQLIADTVHGEEEAPAGKRQHHCRIERFEGNG
nr:hypothetical protein [uncultured Acetatifactor sp.]